MNPTKPTQDACQPDIEVQQRIVRERIAVLLKETADDCQGPTDIAKNILSAAMEILILAYQQEGDCHPWNLRPSNRKAAEANAHKALEGVWDDLMEPAPENPAHTAAALARDLGKMLGGAC